MKEVAVITPIRPLADLASEIVADKGFDNVEVLLGNLTEGLQIAEQAVAAGAKSSFRAAERTI